MKLEICGSLPSGAPPGYDDVSMKTVKETTDLISYLISCIFNLLIRSGIVPDNLKIATVIPLFKSGEQNIFTNYRRLSMLPAFSKILEKVVLYFSINTEFFQKINMTFVNIIPLLMLWLIYTIKFLLQFIIKNILLAFLSTCQKPLRLLIIAFYLKNLSIMAFGAQPWNGLPVILVVDLNLPSPFQLGVVSLRGLF